MTRLFWPELYPIIGGQKDCIAVLLQAVIVVLAADRGHAEPMRLRVKGVVPAPPHKGRREGW